MESHLAAQDSQITSQFVHKISNHGTADWAVRRSEHKWYNSGGNSFSPNGVKNIKFSLTTSGQAMLDPLSCILQFKLVNDDFGDANSNIYMNTFAYNVIKRCVVRCGGVVVSDTDYCNRLAHMLYEFAPKSKRDNLAVMTGDSSTVVTNHKTFGLPLVDPIFLQDKYLPLAFMNIEISLELVDSAADIMKKTADLPSGISGQSQNWHIEEPVIIGSLVDLDTSLSNEFSNMLLKGKSLSIPMIGYFVTPLTVTSGASGFNTSMTRSLSRLRKIYMTFTNNASSKYTYEMLYPALDANNMLEWQAQIGPTKFPSWGALKEQPEYYWNLQQAIGTHQSVFHSNSIDLTDYLTDSFVIGMNLTKVQSEDGSDNFSAISTKQGDLLSFRTRNLNANIDQAWCILEYSMLLQVSEEGCSVFD